MDRVYLTEQFGSWCSSLDYADVPSDVHQAARRALLDTVGVIAAGSRHSATEQARRAFGGYPGPAKMVGGGSTDAASAALINGTAAHAYDFDDTSYTGIMHGSAVIIPAIMATVSEIEVSSDRVLEAFVAGSEIAYTLADVATHHHYFQGWWSTATIGLIGATAAVAKIYQLGSKATAHAIGLAAAGASATKVIVGTDAKPFMVGEAARRAIDFAKAARAGISGPVDVFENDRGFFALLNDHLAELGESQTLGLRWRLVEPGLLFKRYPVCSAGLAAIEQTAILIAEAKCQANDIKRVVCEVPELVSISLVFDDPVTAQQAQFSMPFVTACAILFGEVRLEHISQESLGDPMIRKFMTRIEQVVVSELSTEEMHLKYPECARVTLHLEDGRQHSGFCGEAYGMPQRPISDGDLTAKFCECLGFAGHQPEFAMRCAEGILGHDDNPSDMDLYTMIKQIWDLPVSPNAGVHDRIAHKTEEIVGSTGVEVTHVNKEFLSIQGEGSGLQ